MGVETKGKCAHCGDTLKDEVFAPYCSQPCEGAAAEKEMGTRGKVGHTETPWRKQQHSPYDSSSCDEILGSDGRFVAKVYRLADGVPTDEAMANAAFIVRACNAHEDLVGALTLLVACVEAGSMGTAWRKDNPTRKIVWAALAKAEGREG